MSGSKKSQYKHVYPTAEGRWRVIIDGKHVGVRSTEERAAEAADEYVIKLEEKDDSTTGKWELNFPEHYPPIIKRRFDNAVKRGDFETLFGQFLPNGVTTTPAPTTSTSTPVPNIIVGKEQAQELYQEYLNKDDELFVRKFKWVFPTEQKFTEMCHNVNYKQVLIEKSVQNQFERLAWMDETE